jgi:hypothetical protein
LFYLFSSLLKTLSVLEPSPRSYYTHAGFASKHANINFVLNSAKLASKQNLQIAKEHSHNQTWMGKRILPAIKKYAGLKGVRNTNLA